MFSIFVSAFIIGLLMQYFVIGSLSRPKVKDGVIILKPEKLYSYLGLFGILIAFSLSVVPFTSIADRSTGIEFIPIMSLCFAAIGTYLFAWEARHSIEVHDDKIVSNSFWRKPKSILWVEIDKVNFDDMFLYLKLFNKTAAVRVHMHLPGFKNFLSTMKEKLNSNLYSNALTKVNKAYKKHNVDLSSGF